MAKVPLFPCKTTVDDKTTFTAKALCFVRVFITCPLYFKVVDDVWNKNVRLYIEQLVEV